MVLGAGESQASTGRGLSKAGRAAVEVLVLTEVEADGSLEEWRNAQAAAEARLWQPLLRAEASTERCHGWLAQQRSSSWEPATAAPRRGEPGIPQRRHGRVDAC